MDLIEVEVRPRSPFRLPKLTGGDCLVRAVGPGLERMLIVGRSPVIVRVCPAAVGLFRFCARPAPIEAITGPGCEGLVEAGEDEMLEAIRRFRFAIAIDLDLEPLKKLFGDDNLLAPAITGHAPGRPQRRPQAWEALLWAITEQLIEYRRAAEIQRLMIRKWGLRLKVGTRRSARGAFAEYLGTVPSASSIAAASPAELESCGLGARRAIAMIKVARSVAAGRCDPENPEDDRRLMAIPEIGAWTIACLGLRGRGDPNALLAGDLAQMKLVGYLAGLGRNAEVEEVEAWYERYAPYRGLVGEYILFAQGKPLHGPGNTARIRQRHQRPYPRAA
ncbi:MAG: hypothetical protein WBP55_06855 [Solirubrobacterales bacterium]